MLRTHHPPVPHLSRILQHGGIMISFDIEMGELDLSTFDNQSSNVSRILMIPSRYIKMEETHVDR